MKKLITIIFFFAAAPFFAQTGIIRGTVTDKQSETTIPGATVTLSDVEGITAVTDEKGNFELKDVPVGRHTVSASFMGYENISLPEIEVTTGKDVILNISLQESFNKLEEVVISSERSKAKAINNMAAVSVRQFTTEEVSRYAGGRSDVARLASNFAGVSTADDSRNDIVVRGNSPTGLLWRLEGVPVPSPNHFSTLGTTGSPVSALNPNMLANSDFMTSAFPAEYGNALGGVFDLNLRKGNTQDYEFMAGLAAYPGAEFVAEGPLLRENGGSFLVAARYGIAGLLGLGGTSAQPNYSDLSFNINFGKTKLGTISAFGIYGQSDIDFLGDEIDEKDLFAAKDADSFVESGFYAFGLKHSIDIGSSSYLKTVLSTSSSRNTYDEDRYFNLDTPAEFKIRFTEADNTESRVTFSTLFNSKISSRLTLRTGVLLERFTLDAKQKDRDEQDDNDGDGLPDLVTQLDNNGSYTIAQPYAQAQVRLTEKLTLNAGLHGQYFSVNEQLVAEPRASLTYAFNPKSSLNVGYGLHHQNVAAPLLFLKENVNGTLLETNRDLDLVRSSHYVIGYDFRFAPKWRAKTEVYYQDIDKAAVERTPTSYSSLTEGADFTFSRDKTSLVSRGTGYNTGIELTVEKFFSQGYHALFTTSLFESKYKGSDGIERNSPFNNGYVINFLAGKEFAIGKAKQNVFSVNTKFTTAGGRYYSPVDLEASRAAGYEIRDERNAYSQQYDPYLRIDLRLGMKLNSKSKKTSHQFYVDFQNITNNTNVFTRDYNRLTQNVNQIDQIGFAPDFGYRFQF
ncbi:TonB-dependent receptor [Flavobacterium cyanobacteriorum]|uniref:TonB-dependent receptor n=1 Tax=Flavobacterium cyanobacteriorum TaxID=2022802 RepID=A0A256A196_9FLAO|nr:TonB-dependent receptor [Flavobacterium cyanobacteriorum]OYQ47409.1 TonB-dependent receptor [Flavobacterium cyanobacteriorum]